MMMFCLIPDSTYQIFFKKFRIIGWYGMNIMNDLYSFLSRCAVRLLTSIVLSVCVIVILNLKIYW